MALSEDITFATAKLETLDDVELDESSPLFRIQLDRGPDGWEGMFCLPVGTLSSELSKDNNSNNDLVLVRLCNSPLGMWHGVTWGGLVLARTQGKERLKAFKGDQGVAEINVYNQRLAQLIRRA